MINIDESQVFIVHHTYLILDRLDKIDALDRDHVHTPETDNFRSTLRHVDLLLDQEILDL